MKKYLYLAFGGFGGALLRYFIKNLHLISHSYNTFYNTIIINVLGCFVLSLFLIFCSEIWHIDPDLKLGISVGFLGAFTTFSSLCKDTVLLFNTNFCFSFLYLFLSTILGFTAIYAGNRLGKIIVNNIKQHEAKE